MSRYQIKDMAIAILNWNGRHLLEQFLPSVMRYSNDAPIYIIDNASTDDSVAFIETTYPLITVIQLDNNYGYAGGYNIGLKHIKEPLVCCLNSDIEVSENWLSPILNTFNSSPKLAFVQPKILNYKHPHLFEYAGAAGGFIDKYGYPYCRGRIFESIEEDTGQYNDNIDVFWASGACLFAKQKVFNELRGFDKDFFAHMEEIDLCWRAKNAGYQIRYNGMSTVYHLGGGTLQNQNPQKTFLNFRNSLSTLVKNSPKPFLLVIARLILDGIAALRFLIQLKPQHFWAIIKAHFSFYSYLPQMLKKRKEQKTKIKTYYAINSILWQYFVKGKTNI